MVALIKNFSARARVWLLVANSFLVAILALFLVPHDWLAPCIRYGTLPVLGLLFACFIWVLFRQLKQLPKQAYKKRFSKGILLLVLAGAGFQFVHEDFGYKILMDEYNLTATSMNIHLEKSAFTPTRGRLVQGEFEVVDGYIDKRPFLYPLLLSVVHDLSGYRIENAFVLNSILTVLLFFVIYLAGFHLGAKRGGILAVLVLAGWPLLAQNATGAGFELLNFLLLSLTVFLSLSLTNRPGLNKETLLVLSAILLANVRYESFIFLIPVAILVGLRWKVNNKLGPGWITAFSPWLFAPVIIQIRWFRKQEDLWELPGEVVRAFSLSNIPDNIGHAAVYFFNWSPEYPNSILLTIVGGISLFFLLIAFVKRFPSWLKFSPRDYDVLGLWAFALIGHLLLILAYHAGQLDSHFATRLGMPVHLILILAPVWLLVKEKLGKGFWDAAILVSVLFVITVSAPHSSQAIYSRKNFAEREFRWAYEQLYALKNREFLVIDSKVTHWTSLQWQVMNFDLVRKNQALIREYLDNGTYSDIYVVQRIEFDPAVEGVEVLDADEIPGFELEVFGEFSSRPFEGVRLSRIIKKTFE